MVFNCSLVTRKAQFFWLTPGVFIRVSAPYSNRSCTGKTTKPAWLANIPRKTLS